MGIVDGSVTGVRVMRILRATADGEAEAGPYNKCASDDENYRCTEI